MRILLALVAIIAIPLTISSLAQPARGQRKAPNRPQQRQRDEQFLPNHVLKRSVQAYRAVNDGLVYSRLTSTRRH